MPRPSSDLESAGEIRTQHHVLPNKAEQYITGDGSPAQHTTNALDTAAGAAHCWAVRRS